MGMDVYGKSNNVIQVESPDGKILYDRERDKIMWIDLLKELKRKEITLEDWYNAKYKKDK